MNRALVCLWMLVIAASAMLLIVAGSRAASAYAMASDSRRELISVTHQATELNKLRRAGRDFPDRPAGGLAAKVAAAMSRAGLPSTTLQSLSPEAQTAVPGEVTTRHTRQRATITLANLSLPQVGKFLDAWRTAEPDWIVSSIDLALISTGGRDGPAPIGTDLPLRAVITIEGVFKEHASSKPTTFESPTKPGAPR